MSEDVGVFISKRVKFFLKKQGKTQAWLSKEIGKEPGYISELLNNDPKKRWNEDIINAAVKALGVKIMDLFIEDETAASISKLENEDYEEVKKFLNYRLSLRESKSH